MPINQTPGFQALLTDLDGVIRRWPASNAQLEQAYDLPAGSLSAAAFDPALLEPAIRGQITDEIWRERIADCLGDPYPDADAAAAVTAWTAYAGEVDQAVLALIMEYAPTAKIILVSNATSRLEHDLTVLGIKAHFHTIVNSSQIGIIKPEPGIYAYALRVAGVGANAAVFVDDSARNAAAAAEQLGIRAHHFTGYDGLTDFLREAAKTDR